MKIRTLIYVIILLLVVNVAAISTIVYYRVAAPGEPGRSRFDRRDVPPDFDMPKFSAEERMTMERSRKEMDSLVMPMVQQINGTRGKLLAELNSDNPDTSKVYQLIGEIGALQSAIQKQMVGHFLSDRESLRPEQRKRLLKMIEEHTRWRERGRFGGRKMMGRDL
ncbi:MAG: periplasmic heavy metal sensor [Candidatus Zixiibacteriota bacterium]